MDVENFGKDSNGVKNEEPSLKQELDTPKEPTKDANTEAHFNGVMKNEDGEKPAEKTGENDAKKEQAGDVKPSAAKVNISAHQKENHSHHSDRVREGQRWNDRPRGRGGRGGQNLARGGQKFRRNNRSDLESQEESSDPVAIRKQVEFYFSTSNLLTDKFLFTKITGHENLPVPLSTIHSFKRMRHFQPLSAIITALQESTLLNLIPNKENENDPGIQRKEPLPEHVKGKEMDQVQKVYENEAMARSVYSKGFGDEGSSTQFDIEAFFAGHGTTNSVRLRRHNDGGFKGSVFVEFDSELMQQTFLGLDPKPKWKGKELLVKSKKQYCDDKVEDIKAGRVRANSPDARPSGGRDRRNDQDGDEEDDRDWRTRRDEDARHGFRDDRGRRGDRGYRGGRGGGRGRRRESPRDRHDELRARSPTPESDSGDVNAKTPTKEASKLKDDVDVDALLKEEGKTTAESASEEARAAGPETSSIRKRVREEGDGEAEEQGSAKKVDAKDG